MRVFEGNTADPSTLAAQITLLKEQFQVQDVVVVGDRGMVKAKGKAALGEENFKYITALTNARSVRCSKPASYLPSCSIPILPRSSARASASSCGVMIGACP